jgi:hypothetical protein
MHTHARKQTIKHTHTQFGYHLLFLSSKDASVGLNFTAGIIQCKLKVLVQLNAGRGN